MFKIFEIKKDDFQETTKVHPLIDILSIFIFVSIALILATRDFGLAKDDYNYLHHFSNTINIDFDKIYLFFIEEPLWKLYTWGISFLFRPEVGFKFTIFISAVLFLLSVNRVNKRVILFIIFIFVLHQDFATQMYFNQIRQGFALSIFVFFTVYRRKSFLGAILATLIHSSFFIPLVLIFLIKKFYSIKKLLFFVVGGLLLSYLNFNILKQVDLGRRTDSYLFENKFTIYFYLFAMVKYLPVLYFIGFHGLGNKKNFWYKLAFISFVFILPLTLFYSAAGRLMYYVSAFFLIMILEQYDSRGGKLALGYYIIFIIIEILFFDLQVIENWQKIIA